jgi:PhzF family phenazine biosynthesis protein
MSETFFLVDVFGDRPFMGNQLAVIVDQSGLDLNAMLEITRWFNFSETTFLTAPSDSRADYRVRIFTPDRELPFAGHPTLGSCHAWLASGGTARDRSRIVQECGAGLVTIERTEEGYAFRAPPLIRSDAPNAAEAAEVCAFLGVAPGDVIDMVWADNGPGWIAVLLSSAEQVLAVRPPARYSRRMDVGTVGPHSPGTAAAYELRAFFTDRLGTVKEDPITGSLNASVGEWLFRTGRAQHRYVARQGTQLGRSGRITVTQDAAGAVWVAGSAITLFRGRA